MGAIGLPALATLEAARLRAIMIVAALMPTARLMLAWLMLAGLAREFGRRSSFSARLTPIAVTVASAIIVAIAVIAVLAVPAVALEALIAVLEALTLGRGEHGWLIIGHDGRAAVLAAMGLMRLPVEATILLAAADGLRTEALGVATLITLGLLLSSALRPRTIAAILSVHLLLRGRDDAQIMLGELEITLGRDRVAAALRVTGELQIAICDVLGRTADLHIGSVRLVGARQRVRAAPIATTHALV
jgi:hypothetical protein